MRKSGRGGEDRVPFGIAEVHGPSMVPTLHHGDQLLIRYGVRIRPGDVVVLRHPFQQDLLVVKRAAERRDGGWWVLGDNSFAGGDSTDYGTVPEELVLAKVLGRYRPRAKGQLLVFWLLSALRPVLASRSVRSAASSRSVRSAASSRLRAR